MQTHLSNESKLKSLYQNDRFDKGIHRYLVSEKGKVVVSRVLDNSGSLDLLQNDFRGPVFLHPSCYVSCVAKDIFDKWGPLVSIDQEIEFLSEVFGRKVAVSIKPIPDPENGHKFWSVSVLPLSYYQSLLKSGAQLSLLASVGLVFIMIAWGRWFSGHLTKPLRELNRSAEQIGQGDWEREISIVGDDEIGQLAGSLKKMAARLKDLVKNLESKVGDRTSDLKELLDKYSKANLELEKTNATKDRFFSIIAHDLKSPFMALKGYSAIIEDSFESFDEKQLREMVNRISISAEEAHGLLENLLQWALIQSGGMRVKWEVFDLREVVLEVFDLMKINAKVKGVDLECLIADKVFVEADRNMVSTVLRNLISNGIKFTSSQSGKVLASVKSDSSTVTVSIRDNGVGLKKHEIEKLFSKEAYLSEKGTGDEKGTGIGVGLCKDFVMMNRGNIEVESEVGVGTCFNVSLMASKKGLEEVGHNRRASDEVSVLCVDDSEDNHNLIDIYLKNRGWNVRFSSNGEEALALLSETNFDVILMDINMPVMGGIEATTRYREIEKSEGKPRAKIIAFTSSVLQKDIDAAIKAGCDSYIVKPIKKQKLINSIERLLGVD